jgi:nicotinate phosphoribosyltransferase
MNPYTSPLLTDLYQLTMLDGYLQHDMAATAVFEFFARKLPDDRNFFIAAGLSQALDFLENLSFSDEEVAWLGGCGRFSAKLVDYLADLRFTGDVDAMPEGTIFFPDEPILRVVAPMPQAQLVESRIINLLHFQTLIATKAARCVLAAPGKLLVDFGMRRAHGAEAALLAARASYLAGFAGSATVVSEPTFGVPAYGTMAHSFVQAHDREIDAFEHFASAQPDNVVLLVDTWDTEAGARRVAEVAPRLREQGIAIKAVRLDSGDLAEHARRVRAILDEGGLAETGIFASGGLDEHAIARLIAEDAPIDGFGIGSALDTSADVPYLDCAYKLQEYAGKPRRKLSEGKATWPGRKQVHRHYDGDGHMTYDVLTLVGDEEAGIPLLRPCMRAGRAVAPAEDLAAIRQRVSSELDALPERLRSLERSVPYPVEVAPALRRLAADLDRQEH